MRAPENGYALPFSADTTAAALLGEDGTVLAWSEQASRLLAWEESEVVGTSAARLLARPGAWRKLRARREDGVWEAYAELLHRSSEPVAVGFRVMPFPGAGAGGQDLYLVIGAPAPLIAHWRQDHAFTQELFLQGRIGFVMLDRGLAILRSNAHLLPYTGVPVDMKGRRMADLVLDEEAAVIDERLADVLESGNPLINFTTGVRTRDDPRSGRVLAITAFRLTEPGGHVLGVAAAFTDVTDAHHTQHRLDRLHAAGSVLGSSLSVVQTCHDAAELLAPTPGHVAAVDVYEGVLRGGDVSDPRDHGALSRTAVAGHPTPLPSAVPQERAAEVVVDVATSGAGHWATAVPGAVSAVCAPMRAGGLVLGMVTVWRTDAEVAPFGSSDLQLLEELANRAALAVDNARRYTWERRAAAALQRSLLPSATADTPAVESVTLYLPAQHSNGLSGDWFDVIPLSSTRVALVVGDVIGHGLEATVTMGRLRTAVRTLADMELGPDEILTQIDGLVRQFAEEAEGESGGDRLAAHPDTIGATCLVAEYDPTDGRLVMAGAGHPPPAVVGPDGDTRFLPLVPGPPLGVGGLPFEKSICTLEEGTVLALYTDGFVEGRDHDLGVGMRGLLDELMAAGLPKGPLPAVLERIATGVRPQDRADDSTLLLARTRRVSAEDTAHWELDNDPALVREARALVARQLVEWELEELSFSTELIVSELVTNAIVHAGDGPIGLRLIRADGFTCEVSDSSSTQPRMRRALGSDEGGRGLFMVAQLSHRWGSRYTDEGKTIWSEQALPPR